MKLEREVGENKGMNRGGFLKAGVLGLLAVSGCSINLSGPGGRLGCAPNATIITTYLGENAAKKQRGIAYTCKAGNLDIAHVRKYAEWTEYFAKKSSKILNEDKSGFSFSSHDPGKFNFSIYYPSDWQSLIDYEKEKIIKDVSIELGQNLSYNMSLWHEMLTWFGWKYTGIIPEFNSAFSWEDRFSDTFGCYVGGEALKQGGKFQKTLSGILNKEIERLGVQSKEVTKKSVKNVKGDWFGGSGFSSNMRMRNLDVGLDGYVTPPVPPTRECEGVETWNCPVPNLKQTEGYGFKIDIYISPSGKEGKNIMAVAGRNDMIDVRTDFSKIMQYIKEDAISRGYKVIY